MISVGPVWRWSDGGLQGHWLPPAGRAVEARGSHVITFCWQSGHTGHTCFCWEETDIGPDASSGLTWWPGICSDQRVTATATGSHSSPHTRSRLLVGKAFQIYSLKQLWSLQVNIMNCSPQAYVTSPGLPYFITASLYLRTPPPISPTPPSPPPRLWQRPLCFESEWVGWLVFRFRM